MPLALSESAHRFGQVFPPGMSALVVVVMSVHLPPTAKPHLALPPEAASRVPVVNRSRAESSKKITVLDVPYRLWAKAVVQGWASTLQAAYLGEAALGFQAQSGALHAVQLVKYLIALQP